MIKQISVFTLMMLFTQTVILTGQTNNLTVKDTPQKERGGDRLFGKISKDLNLSDNQKLKMKALQDERKKQHQKDAELLKQRNLEYDAKVKSILDADQYAKFSQQKQKIKEKAKHRRGKSKKHVEGIE